MATNTTATSQNHNGTGSQNNFAISFSFLANTEVDVKVGGVLKTLGTHYNIVGSQVQFTSGNTPPSGTANVVFTRDTDISAKKVDFADGSVLTETDLDNNSDQLLLAQQEIINDYVKRDGSQTITGNFVFEGATDDGNETTLAITDPTADRTITVPDVTGTLVTTGDTGTVSNNMLADAELKELATMANDTASSLADLTAAEVQTIDGITASTSELNKLDGVTASTDEINKLDGVTATTTEINHIDGVTSNIQTQLNNKQPLDSELTTLAGMQAATASKLADSTALTSDIADLNQIDGMAKQTTITDDDTKFPTSGAVVDFVAAQIAPIGGLEVIANEDSFPTTQPASGVVISISDIEGLIVNGSGVATNARTSGNGSDNVTINGFPSSLQSKTMAAGLGLMVSSTGSSQTYTYHKLLAKEADVEQLSNDINDFAARYRVTNGEPNSDNDEGDLIYDKDADKMKVFDSTTNAFKEVTSVGDYKFLFLCPAGGTGSPTINGNIATYDLREGSTSGSAATVTNAAQLIVSINGVIQKPNTGTSAPSEGFAMVDSNTIIFGSNLPTGASIFIVQIGSATTLNVPADNSVSTAKLQSGSINNAKVATDAAIDSTKLSFTGTGTGATARTISTKLLEQVSVKDYGATGDGSTDDTTAIQNALNAANAFTPKKGVFVPAGKYKLTNRLLVPHGVSLIGEGMGVTIFDTTTATYSSFTSYSGSGKAVIHTPAPTYTQIADPSADIARNAKSFAIASISSPSAIAEGDFLLIWNDTDGSFSAHRTYYKAGEILKISDINSTTLFFESSVVDDYTASAVNLYKVTYGQQDFKGFTILCNPAGGSQAFGLIAQGLKHSVVRDVEVLNAPYTGISVQECYDITVDRCHATDNHLENSGEYGLSIGNSQVVSVSNGKFTAARHGLATGGSSGIGSITCRFMSFTNNNVTTSDANGAGNTQAFNLHGNSEYVTVSNNTFDGGANIAGDHTIWTGNNMYGKSLNGSAVLATEMVGFSHTFKGNIIRSTMTDGERGVFIDFGGNSEVFEGNGETKHGGNLVIDGNTLIWDNIDNTRTYTGIIVKNTSFAEAEKIKLIITNNTTIGQKVKTDNDGTQFGSFIMVEWGAGSAWDEINISNNVVHGGYHIREVGSDPEVAAKNVYVHNNHFKRGYYCIANNVTDLYSCKGNTFEQFEQYIGSFGENSDSDNTDYHTKVVHFTDNTLIDVMWGYNSSSSTRASVTLWRCQKVYCSNNIIMGNPVKLRMDQDIGGLAASHEKGDIITGGSSGKVATVLGEQGTFLHIGTTARTASAMFPHPSSDSYIGNWTDGETITATGRTDVTLDGAAPVNTRTYAFSFLRVGKLYEYLNIDEQGLNNYYGTNVTQKARLYDDSGALKYKGSGGTTTTLGAA